MNKCHFKKELSSYLDNQLSESRKQEIGEHLKECEICAQELSHLELLSEKLKEWQAPCLGPFFENAVKDGIAALGLEREVKMKKKTLFILVPSGVLAGILVFLFVGGLTQLYVKRGVQEKLRSDTTDKLSKPELAQLLYSKVADDINISYDRSIVPSNSGGQRREREDRIMQQFDSREGAEAFQQSMMNAGIKLSAPTAQPTQTSSPGEGPVIVIQPVLPATGEGDKIIRFAEVKLEVENGKEAYKKATEICQNLGGYLASSNFSKDSEGRETGTLTMRIPKEKFLLALDELGALGKVESSSTSSQDVRQEYANLKSQLDAAMVVYNKTFEALQKKQVTIPEAIRLESELTPILRRVQDLKNKIEHLNNAVSYTTIVVNFYEQRVSMKALKEAKQHINESMLAAKINAVKFFANAIPLLIGIMAVLLILTGAVILITYWIIRVFKRG